LGIRRYKKDHLKELAPALAEVVVEAPHPEADNPLQFWTSHEHPTLVDLTVFASGDYAGARSDTPGSRRRAFGGRPALIAELAPALRALLEYAAPRTAAQYVQSLRDWWRLFDTVERDASKVASNVPMVQSVGDIGELHRQCAVNDNMDRNAFGNILAVINTVRKTKGMRRLAWRRPDPKRRVRHLPPEWQVREIRLALKHKWFAALDRWQAADELLNGRPPKNEEEQRLLTNYQAFDEAVGRSGHPRPEFEDIRNGMSKTTFHRSGFSIPDMLRGRYPDADDIRHAFHLCLATTGWNPSVLLSLDANANVIETHPKDASRYILRGYKARSRSEQQTEGLYKSQGSAGAILLTLLKRTASLRFRLREDLVKQEAAYQELLREKTSKVKLDAQRKVVAKLRIGVSSYWLYVTSASDRIHWLDPNEASYSRGSDRADGLSFLDGVVAQINRRRPADRQVAFLKPGDFRDAFAAYAYRTSGGMILYVMKALGHRSLRSTQVYLDNTLLNDQSLKLYQTFSNTLWTEIKVHKRLDPTLIAKCSRDGEASDEQRQRLGMYRNLRRSRIGVGCKDPAHPPSHIAPNFRADGKAMCHVHRCMLCLEHAVIFPDSLPGLTKRLAELRAIRGRMSAVAFIESSFGEELENTELALAAFDAGTIAGLTREWEGRINDGLHRVVELDGVQEFAA
jgi:integrase